MDDTSEIARPDRAEALVARFERSGYVRARPAILQPAEPFLDLSGEDIRRRMLLATDASGTELCLRPDLTIPVACDYLRSAHAGTPRAFCYLGPVFRQSDDGPGEILQAGIESFGRGDTAEADAEMLALGLEASGHYGEAKPEIRIGDVGLFMSFIAALDLAPAWKRRLLSDFNRKASLAQDLARLSLDAATGRPEYQGVLSALAGSNPQAAHALVADLLAIAGISTVGGRSADEIADRFLEQAALGAAVRLPRKMRAAIERFLSIDGNPIAALKELRALAGEESLAMEASLDLFERRTGLFAARGIDISRVHFSAAFGRGLDYYTGFVFELHDATDAASGPLVAGGRYDELLTRLGSARPIPAVGFAVWIERLAQRGGSS
jgi:ATP phosphoribosyltransferase regulatory subunit